MRKASTLILLVLAAAAALAQQTPSQKHPQTTLKVDVKLVNVYVTVTDAHGAPVAGLKKDNFTVLEDGIPETISVFDKESALPLSIALAIDTSLSTRHDLPLEQASAKRFAKDIVRPVDVLSVFGFNEAVSQSVSYTSDLKRIEEGIDHIRVGAATALYDAVYLTSRSLDRRQGRKVLVLITDGGDTISKIDYQGAARAAEEAEALVTALSLCPLKTARDAKPAASMRSSSYRKILAASITMPLPCLSSTMLSARSATSFAPSICWHTILRKGSRTRNFDAFRSGSKLWGMRRIMCGTGLVITQQNLISEAALSGKSNTRSQCARELKMGSARV